ncbi:MAG: 16S rRNA (guanine(527)-N(7))-methyltransferase RsmG [Betaproteobacteria bacterium]|nr:16S rRNA (guanine(527)-N(7))-methyltransferase RsmG [Betaproteobacteria bacterium]
MPNAALRAARPRETHPRPNRKSLEGRRVNEALRADTLPDHVLLEELGSGVAAMNIALDETQMQALIAYVRMIDKWNRTFNLTAIREPERMVGLHLLDSLAVVPHIPRDAVLADVGSGAGLPGIPIAIARPDVRITLIDTVAKKATFMQQVVGELRLPNLEVRHARVETLALNSPCDIVISRAFAELKDFAESSAHLLRAGGKLFAMKGVLPHEEIARLPARFTVDATRPLHVSGVEGQRHLIVISPSP